MDTALEENCNFIVTGRNKRSSFISRFFSSAIDLVLQKTTLEVAILHGEINPGKIRKILIPYSGDVHTRLAIEISPALIAHFNAVITIGVVISPQTNELKRSMITDQIKKVLADDNLKASIEMIADPDILHGILRLAKNADLMVMGGKSGEFIELLFSKSLAREITEQVSCPVLWLKEYEERESFISSLFKSQEK